MIILGLDQASKLGFSLFANGKLIKYGLADFTKYKPFNVRISEIKSTVFDFIEEFNPDYIALEDVQLQSNADTHKKLSMLLGVLENALLEGKYQYEIIPVGEWRKLTGVKGRKREEQKKSAQAIVQRIYGLDVSEDEADAILIGCAIDKKLSINH